MYFGEKTHRGKMSFSSYRFKSIYTVSMASLLMLTFIMPPRKYDWVSPTVKLLFYPSFQATLHKEWGVILHLFKGCERSKQPAIDIHVLISRTVNISVYMTKRN